MRVMFWTLQDKREQRPASCMLYLASIGYNLHTKTAQVEALHSLGQSRLPPHAVCLITSPWSTDYAVIFVKAFEKVTLLCCEGGCVCEA